MDFYYDKDTDTYLTKHEWVGQFGKNDQTKETFDIFFKQFIENQHKNFYKAMDQMMKKKETYGYSEHLNHHAKTIISDVDFFLSNSD
jgi:hypothetical protein